MSLPKPGEILHLKVAARYSHHAGVTPLKSPPTVRVLGNANPSLQVRLIAGSMAQQNQLNGWAKGIGNEWTARIAPWLLRPGPTGGLSVPAVLDTGAPFCLMSTYYAIQSLGEAIRWDQDDTSRRSLKMNDGTKVDGKKYWMQMEIIPTSTRVWVPFLVSERLEAPLLISWQSIRKVYHFVLKHDHMALCE